MTIHLKIRTNPHFTKPSAHAASTHRRLLQAMASSSTVVQWSNHKGQKFEQRKLLLDVDGVWHVTRV